jgi:hypothetical protein
MCNKREKQEFTIVLVKWSVTMSKLENCLVEFFGHFFVAS